MKIASEEVDKGNQVVTVHEDAMISSDNNTYSTNSQLASNKVGIIMVSDKQFQKSQVLQFATTRAYANRHGYDYHLLAPADIAPVICKQKYKSFFFQKHCTVLHFLVQQPPGYTAVVLDGDVVPVSFDVSLKQWLDIPSDIILYERSWNYEVTAGNYIVRNTEFGRHFLQLWSDFEYQMPTGFSSADNGAIHLAVLQSIGHVDPTCVQEYHSLTASVNNLQPYFHFVRCTRIALGPSRRWIVGNSISKNSPLSGSLTVLNRYQGFCIDGFIVSQKHSGAIPLYHGLKNMTSLHETFEYKFEIEDTNANLDRDVGSKAIFMKDISKMTNLEVWTTCAFDDEAKCHVTIESKNKFKDMEAFWAKLKNNEKTWLVVSSGADHHQVPRYDLSTCLPNCHYLEQDEIPPRNAFKEADEKNPVFQHWNKEASNGIEIVRKTIPKGVENYHEECYVQCRIGGACPNFCGAKGFCCRDGFNEPGCKNIGCASYHCCDGN